MHVQYVRLARESKLIASKLQSPFMIIVSNNEEEQERELCPTETAVQLSDDGVLMGGARWWS